MGDNCDQLTLFNVQAYLQLLQQQMGSSASSGAATAGNLTNQLGNVQQLPSLNNVSVQQLLAASQGNLATQQMFDSPGMLTLCLQAAVVTLCDGIDLVSSLWDDYYYPVSSFE